MIAAVCDRPDDDTPRLVFADFLDDVGEAARAAFIRLHVTYAREARKTYRKKMERQINHALRGVVTMRSQAWVAAILDDERMGLSVNGWGYTVVPVNHLATVRRGFVDSIVTPPGRFVETGARLMASHPIQSVELFGAGVRLEIDPPGDDYGWQVYAYEETAPGAGRDDYTNFIGGLDTREEMVEAIVSFARDLALVA